MDFQSLAKKRYSCRKFRPEPVEREKIRRILEAGRVAPSACNKQPWLVVVITDEVMLEKVRGTYHRGWFRSAPAVLVVCCDHHQSWKREDGKDHADIDAAIFADHLTLAAAEEGLGTCWVCHFDHDRCAELLGLPAQLEPMAMLPLGYPDDTPDPDRHDRLRKPLDEIVRWI